MYILIAMSSGHLSISREFDVEFFKENSVSEMIDFMRAAIELQADFYGMELPKTIKSKSRFTTSRVREQLWHMLRQTIAKASLIQRETALLEKEGEETGNVAIDASR